MKDLDQNSDQDRFRRILNNKIITPTDVGFLLGSGVREFRNFLLDQAGMVFSDDVLDEPTLEDVVQDLLLTFESSRLGKFSGKAKFSTYLISCVVNRSRTKFDQLKKRCNTTQSIAVSESNEKSLVDGAKCAARKHESEDLQHHVVEQIKPVAVAFVSSLSLEDKTLLRLRYREEVKWKTIAGILGCSEAAAKQRRNRIVKRLKAKVFPERG